MEKVNTSDIQKKLIEKLTPSGWATRMRTFLNSADMKKILDTLLEESNDGKRFTPPVKIMFRAFEECPYDKIRVVIIGQDPYPQIGVADGLAFSCSLVPYEQPSLEYIFSNIQDTIYSAGYTGDKDLKRWADQGVLLLNSAFTTTIGKPGTHQMLWRPFLIHVLDYLRWNNPGLIYVFMGKMAQEYIDIVGETGYKLVCSHPASAAYQGAKIWDSGDVWNQINNILYKNNGDKITW